MHVQCHTNFVVGGTSILAKPGHWRGQPFYESCISLNTREVLKQSGAWQHIVENGTIGPPNSNSSCNSTIWSPEAVVKRNNEKANIYRFAQFCLLFRVLKVQPENCALVCRCPGGEAACPAKNSDQCGTGSEPLSELVIALLVPVVDVCIWQDIAALLVLFVSQAGHQARAMCAMNAAEAHVLLKSLWCARWFSYYLVFISTFYADHCGKKDLESSAK